MKRLFFFLLIIIISFNNCTDKSTSVNSSIAFKSFEISYTNGWSSGFSILVDTNKIYFSPQLSDFSYYGILPDTIFDLLDTTFLKIRSDSNIKSKDSGCVDCPSLAIQIISNDDTLRIKQTGSFDKIFYPVIKSLRNFIESSKHQKIHGIFLLDTRSVITPQPPEIKVIHFKPPQID